MDQWFRGRLKFSRCIYILAERKKNRGLNQCTNYKFVTEARKITENLNQARRRPVPRLKPVISRETTQKLELEWTSLTTEFNNLCKDSLRWDNIF